MKNRFSKEWLFNECENHKHALGITLEGEPFPSHIVINIVLSEKEREHMMLNIFKGIDTNSGILNCEGYADLLSEEIKTFTLNIEDIKEVDIRK